MILLIGIWMFILMFFCFYISRIIEYVVLCIKELELVVVIRIVIRVRIVIYVVIVILMLRVVIVVFFMCCVKGSNFSYVLV